MDNKKLEDARVLVNVIESYNFIIMVITCFAFVFIYLNIEVIFIYALVVCLILTAIAKHLHIERYLKE